jgi:hypothetical protein
VTSTVEDLGGVPGAIDDFPIEINERGSPA